MSKFPATPGLSRARLVELLDPLDECPVECDGFARLAATVLSALNIPYRAFRGEIISADRQRVPLHFWLQCRDEDGALLNIDYRARMWLTGAAPHGVKQVQSEAADEWFEPSQQVDSELFICEGFYYQGQSCNVPPLNPLLFELLSGKDLKALLPDC